MRTEDLEAFFAIVEGGGVTAAAAKLELPKSTISRRLARLEEELDGQLILRTPRKSQVTELGQALHRRGVPALRLLEELQRDILERGSEPRGLLRVSAPPDLAAFHLGPLIADFAARHPKVSIELGAGNAYADLIADGIDVGLRIHSQPLADSSSLRARKLCDVHGGLYASTDYLDARGRPRKPESLDKHDILSMGLRPGRLPMTQPRTGRTAELRFGARLRSNEHHLLRDVAIAGGGIATLPGFIGEPAVNEGKLERVMPGWRIVQARLSAVWPTAHHTSPRVRRFVDAAADYFSPPPWKE